MSLRIALAALIFAFAPNAALFAASAQAAANPAQPRSQSSLAVGNSLQQVSIAIAHLRRTLDAVNVPRWMAPNNVRGTTESDIDSMQRDVSGTLPDLINAALADPSKVSPAFSVYRNVDALYDVLLRVSETAQLAGSNDGRLLEEQRAMLEDSRTQLGAALLNSAQAQDADVLRLRTAATVAAPAPAPTKTVVDDGPATSKSTKKHAHKPAPANPQ